MGEIYGLSNKISEIWVSGNKIKEVWSGSNKIWSSGTDLWLGYINHTQDINDLISATNSATKGNMGIYYYDGYYYTFTDEANPSSNGYSLTSQNVTLSRTKDGITYEQIATIPCYGFEMYRIPMYYMNGYMVYAFGSSSAATGYGAYIRYSKDGTTWTQVQIPHGGNTRASSSYRDPSTISMCRLNGVYYLAVSYTKDSTWHKTIFKCTNSEPNSWSIFYHINDQTGAGCSVFTNGKSLYFTYYGGKHYVIKFTSPTSNTNNTVIYSWSATSYSDGDGGTNCGGQLINVINKTYAHFSYGEHGNNSDFQKGFTVNMNNDTVSMSSNYYLSNPAVKDGDYYYGEIWGYRLCKLSADGTSTTVLLSNNYYTPRYSRMSYGESNFICGEM